MVVTTAKMASTGAERRKRLGYFDTPENVVRFMVSLIPRERLLRADSILEPASGLAPFSRVIASIRGSWRGMMGIDWNEDVVMAVKDMYPGFNVVGGDYLLYDFLAEFDIIVGNPPYGIVGDESHYAISVFKDRKELYKRLYTTWKGKYNIYGLFIEKSVSLLRKKGILVFIVPATWLILDEFEKLRRFLAKEGSIDVYYVGRVFKGLNVVAVVLYFVKGEKGLRLYDAEGLTKPRLVVEKKNYGGEMITFETRYTRLVEKAAATNLGSLFEIRISPRSPEIMKNPCVSRERRGEEYVPILNGRNLKPGKIDYETCYSGYYIRKNCISGLKPWFTRDRIVVGHTKGGKIVSAIDYKHYPWMGDVYHLMPKKLSTLTHRFTLEEVNAILNSEAMNRYMEEKYRRITPHVTKTQLKILPLIPLGKLEKIQ